MVDQKYAPLDADSRLTRSCRRLMPARSSATWERGWLEILALSVGLLVGGAVAFDLGQCRIFLTGH